ncbi:MAG: flavin reductase family protein [Oscillospiraceae bacterium]|nr:flavin reductase family protein [Oscillospiraceae bacterium]
MFRKIDPKELTQNPFTLIGQQWMLVTAGTVESCNTMTASWGGVGIMWGNPVATCYIRPQRHTKQFMDNEEYFTLSFLAEDYRDALRFCGSKSGRDVNKFTACNLTVTGAECGAPYVAESELVLVCKKQYAQPMAPEFLTEGDAIDKRWYPANDWHTMYIGQIVEVYVKE